MNQEFEPDRIDPGLDSAAPAGGCFWYWGAGFNDLRGGKRVVIAPKREHLYRHFFHKLKDSGPAPNT